MSQLVLSVFSKACEEVFREIGFYDLNITDADVLANGAEVVANVGLTGGIHGYLLISSDKDSIINFISRMLQNMGMDSEEEDFGQFHREALGEVLNQISGRSMMKLAEQGIDCDITPPTIITGNRILPGMNNLDRIESKLITGFFGRIGLFVGLTKT
ncbi:MAG: chemotaxis protein CheX [Spirochaetales bacterium]|nr:chemotaxis protein CheX [Spirochaetales bacterium]